MILIFYDNTSRLYVFCWIWTTGYQPYYLFEPGFITGCSSNNNKWWFFFRIWRPPVPGISQLVFLRLISTMVIFLLGCARAKSGYCREEINLTRRQSDTIHIQLLRFANSLLVWMSLIYNGHVRLRYCSQWYRFSM